MSVTRRGFLAGSAAAAAAPSFAGSPATAGSEARSQGPGAIELHLRVNGRGVRLELEPRTTLLEALRWQLGLTGPKEVCDRGACGACTVLRDGKPVLACMSLAVECAGSELTTVEGLGSPQRPSRVQQAMIQHDAVQCGYCIPGFVMSFEAALRRNAAAGEGELRDAMAGNLCRCGTYTKMFETAARLAGGDPDAGLPAENSMVSLESALPRVDGPEKITGVAVYAADARRADMLFAQHVPCPYARATLEAADLDAVRRLAGIVEAEVDVGEEFEFAGAPAGYVCATSPAALRDGLTALNLRWIVQEKETDPFALHEEQYGAFPPPEEQREDWRDAGAAQAALREATRVVERVYTTQVQNHCTLEPHGAMVDPTVEPAEGWISTQATFSCVPGLARGLGVGNDEIAVKCDYVGGGFGSKFGAGREGQLAAQLAGRHGKPVRVFNNREYEHLDTGNRPGSLQWMRIGVRRDGRITGGFVYHAGTAGSGGGGGRVVNPSRYDFGATAVRHTEVNVPHGVPRPFRAPGHPQGMFAVESMMDELAEEIGRDPVEFRLLNETSEVRKRMLPEGAARIGWDRRQPSGSQTGRWRRGFGVGAGDWGNRRGRCDVRLEVGPDGLVRLYNGTQDIGTGQRTVLADTCAHALGLPRSSVEVHMADSRYPFGPGSGGSVTARTSAPAVRDAAASLLAELGFDAAGAPSQVAWRAACAKLSEEGVSVEGQFNRDYWGEGGSECVQFVEALVDAGTGVVRIEKIVALQACGLAVNRLTAENQVIGGVIQGLSFALFEEKVVDPHHGYQLNSDLLQYKIAGAADVPEIVPLLWGHADGLGVRSLGEPTTIPTAGAIANAVANATGARVRSLPITPGRVLEALEAQA